MINTSWLSIEINNQNRSRLNEFEADLGVVYWLSRAVEVSTTLHFSHRELCVVL